MAANQIAWGKFLNAGQTCVAPDHLLVHEDVVDEFSDLSPTPLRRQRLTKPTRMDPPLLYPPFTKLKKWILRQALTRL